MKKLLTMPGAHTARARPWIDSEETPHHAGRAHGTGAPLARLVRRVCQAAHLAFLSLSAQAARSVYTGWMTAKEQLQQLVAEMGEEQASRALGLIKPVLQEQPDSGQPPRLPEFVGSGDSGRSDLSERVDELLAEGFGR